MNEQSYTFLTIQIPIVEVCIETNTNLHILLLLFLLKIMKRRTIDFLSVLNA